MTLLPPTSMCRQKHLRWCNSSMLSAAAPAKWATQRKPSAEGYIEGRNRPDEDDVIQRPAREASIWTAITSPRSRKKHRQPTALPLLDPNVVPTSRLSA